MRRGSRVSGLVLGVCLLLGSGASAEVYRWTDAAGREHFSGELTQVPPEQRAAAARAAEQRGPSRLQTFETPATRRPVRAGAPRGVLRIPYEQHGNAILVYARLNDRVTAPFYVDTGAADVVVPADVAAQAGIAIGADTPREVYNTANGILQQAVVHLDTVEVGEARVEHVRGSVSESLPVGLLGTSFLGNFTLQIDPAARMLTLIQNPGLRGGASQSQWSERFRALRERQARLDAHLEEMLTSESRVRELEARREQLAAELEALEREADRSEVPVGWRE